MARKSTEIDLMAPFLDMQRAAKENRGLRVRVEPLVVDLDPGLLGGSLAVHLEKAAKQQIRTSRWQPSSATRARRERSRANPDRVRYPAGRSPNPAGGYGVDSGLLRDSIEAWLEKGTGSLRIPANRAKAAFVIRDKVPALGPDMNHPKNRTAVDRAYTEALDAMLQVGKTAKASARKAKKLKRRGRVKR